MPRSLIIVSVLTRVRKDLRVNIRKAVVKWSLKNSLFYKCRRTQGVEEVCLENKEECKSSRAFESFRRRGIIEKPSRGDTVLTNSLILYGPLVKKSITLACHARGHQFKSGMGRHRSLSIVINADSEV